MAQHKPRVTRQQSRTSAAISEIPEMYEDMYGEQWVEWEGGEEGWEDEEDEMLQPMYAGTSSPAGSAFGRGFRKRRRPPVSTNGTRKHTHTFSSSTTAKQSRAGRKSQLEQASITLEDVVNGAFHGASFTAKYAFHGALFTAEYAFDVFVRAFHYLRYPLSLFFFLWLLVYLTGKMHHTFRSAFAP